MCIRDRNNSIQYIHDIKAEGDIQKLLLYLLISYKKIRANICLLYTSFKPGVWLENQRLVRNGKIESYINEDRVQILDYRCV